MTAVQTHTFPPFAISSHFLPYLGCREASESVRRGPLLARVPWGLGATHGLEGSVISHIVGAMFALGEDQVI